MAKGCKGGCDTVEEAGTREGRVAGLKESKMECDRVDRGTREAVAGLRG